MCRKCAKKKNPSDCEGATIKLTRSRQNVVSRTFSSSSPTARPNSAVTWCNLMFLSAVLLQFFFFFGETSPMLPAEHTLPASRSPSSHFGFAFKLDCKTRKRNQIREKIVTLYFWCYFCLFRWLFHLLASLFGLKNLFSSVLTTRRF